MASSGTWYEPNDILLLTGAGFTKTYGGYLASEMWAAILNQFEVQKDATLRSVMLSDLNFERVYNSVQNSDDLGRDQKDGLTKAISKSYAAMEHILANHDLHVSESAHGVCKSFLKQFSGEGKQRGFLFTLNQDLFVERYYSNEHYTTGIGIPGLAPRPEWFRADRRFELDATYSVILPDDTSLEKSNKKFWDKGTGQFKYIKLHGSYGWRSYDGSNVMVLGDNKEGMIDKEPLLRWYKELFRQVLHWPKKKIRIVIGYSFRDSHINKVIAEAIQAGILQLCSISPQSPEQFRNDLCPLHGFNA